MKKPYHSDNRYDNYRNSTPLHFVILSKTGGAVKLFLQFIKFVTMNRCESFFGHTIFSLRLPLSHLPHL